jgi:2-polyprenyl-3-methyl-5-hydroxy-6-metoxy-1,4-benzoquinol methylase
VACGLGDDAEELARRGYRVTAFDIAPTAIRLCHERFPDSPVDYLVADVLALPAAWRRAFVLVVEIATVQSLAPDQQRAGTAAIADTVAPGGSLFMHALVRREWEERPTRPYPVTPAALAEYVADGLVLVSSQPVQPASDMVGVEAVYVRPAGTTG